VFGVKVMKWVYFPPFSGNSGKSRNAMALPQARTGALTKAKLGERSSRLIVGRIIKLIVATESNPPVLTRDHGIVNAV
jgi:hypothetical protein